MPSVVKKTCTHGRNFIQKHLLNLSTKRTSFETHTPILCALYWKCAQTKHSSYARTIGCVYLLAFTTPNIAHRKIVFVLKTCIACIFGIIYICMNKLSGCEQLKLYIVVFQIKPFRRRNIWNREKPKCKCMRTIAFKKSQNLIRKPIELVRFFRLLFAVNGNSMHRMGDFN